MPHTKTTWYPAGDPNQTEITADRLNNAEAQYDDAVAAAQNLANAAKASPSIPSFIEVRDSDPTDPDLLSQIGRIWLLTTPNQ